MKFGSLELFFIFAVSSQLTESREHHKYCPRGFYSNLLALPSSAWSERCLLCSSCQVGFGITRKCTSSSNTKCKTCLAGREYTAAWGGGSYCRTCKKCGPGRDVVKQCTASSDTQCGECKKGFYWSSIRASCEPCSWCFPEVFPPNQYYVAHACAAAGIDTNYQCIRLQFDRPQPTWFNHLEEMQKKTRYHEFRGEVGESSGNYGSGKGESGFGDTEILASGDAEQGSGVVTSLVGDDEDIPRIRAEKQDTVVHSDKQHTDPYDEHRASTKHYIISVTPRRRPPPKLTHNTSVSPATVLSTVASLNVEIGLRNVLKHSNNVNAADEEANTLNQTVAILSTALVVILLLCCALALGVILLYKRVSRLTTTFGKSLEDNDTFVEDLLLKDYLP